MNKRSKYTLVYGLLITMICFALLFSLMVKIPQQKHTPLDSEVPVIVTKTCPTESNMRTFFETQEAEVMTWNSTYFMVVFTAKRMGHETYAEYKAFESHPTINPDDIIAMTNENPCDFDEVLALEVQWAKWHKKRMEFLKDFQDDYPNVVKVSNDGIIIPIS
jgi:hypothetical protein